MPVDTQEKPISRAFRRIDIRKLVIEQPKKADVVGPFDPVDEINAQNLDDVIFYLKDESEVAESVNMNYFLALDAFSYLYPEKVKDLEISDLIVHFPTENPAAFPIIAEAIKRTVGQEALNRVADQKTWKHVRSLIKNDIDVNWGGYLPERLAAYKRLFPSLEEPDIFSSNEDYLINGFSEVGNENFESKAAIAANLRVIFPHRIKDLKLPPNFWEEARKELAKLEQLSWPRYTILALNLHILAAKEVKITEDGMELVMPEKSYQEEQPPPLPEAKRF